jgi:hypothetical protein
VVPGKLTVVVTVSVSVGPGAVVVTVTVTVDPGAVVGAVSGLLVVVDVVGMVSEGGIVGVLVEVVVDVVLDVLVGVVVDVLVDISGGVVVDVVVDAVVDVVVDVVDVFVHTGQVVIVDVDVSVTMPSELAISAGDSVEFCLLAKIYSGRVVIVDVPVSVALIGDDPGVVAVIDGVVERLTGIECSRTVEYASDLAWRLLVACSILEIIWNNTIATDLPRFRHSNCLKNGLSHCHIVCRISTQCQHAIHLQRI